MGKGKWAIKGTMRGKTEAGQVTRGENISKNVKTVNQHQEKTYLKKTETFYLRILD